MDFCFFFLIFKRFKDKIKIQKIKETILLIFHSIFNSFSTFFLDSFCWIFFLLFFFFEGFWRTNQTTQFYILPSPDCAFVNNKFVCGSNFIFLTIKDFNSNAVIDGALESNGIDSKFLFAQDVNLKCTLISNSQKQKWRKGTI